jgi:hypothetical protein
MHTCNAGHSRLRTTAAEALQYTRRDEQQGEKGIYGRGGIGVSARAPAEHSLRKGMEEKKKIEFLSWLRSAHLRAEHSSKRTMEIFQIFHEIKSERSTPFCSGRIWTCARGIV